MDRIIQFLTWNLLTKVYRVHKLETVSDKIGVNEIYLKTFKSRLNYQLRQQFPDQIESILELCPDIMAMLQFTQL